MLEQFAKAYDINCKNKKQLGGWGILNIQHI